MKRLLVVACLVVVDAFAQPTAKYPGALPAWTDVFRAANDVGSTLSTGIDDTTLTVPVVDDSDFVTPCVVTVEDENMRICSKSGNDLTVCSGGRGYDSTAASHVSGKAVEMLIMAQHHENVATEVIAIATALGTNMSNTSPGGSGTEIQYRAGASTFGAVTNSSVSGASVIWKAIQTITLDAIGSTSSTGWLFQNTTAATTGQQQWSPAISLVGRAWDQAGTESLSATWIIENAVQRSQTRLDSLDNLGLAGLRISFQAENGTKIPFFHMYHDPAGTPGADSPYPNFFMGFNAGNQSMTGQAFANQCIGQNCMHSLSTGDENLSYGWNSLYGLTTGVWNSCTGHECLTTTNAGSFNVAAGQNAGWGGFNIYAGNTDGSRNSYFGVDTGNSTFMTRNNMVILGYGAFGDQSDFGSLGEPGLFWTVGGNTKSENTFEVVDTTVVGSQILNETSFSTYTKWTQGGGDDFDDTYPGGKAVWTYSAGWGYLFQTVANMAGTPTDDRWYEFQYTVDSFTTGVTCYVWTEFASTVNPNIQLQASAYPKSYTYYVHATELIASFGLSCDGSAGAVTFDDFSLKEITGGDLFVNSALAADSLALREDAVVVGSVTSKEFMEVYDSTVLGSESLNETDFATHAKWDDVGDMDSEGGDATYTHSGGTGTLTQTAANQLLSAVGSRWYLFAYTLGAGQCDTVCEITTAYALAATPIIIQIPAGGWAFPGDHEILFRSAVAPTDFVISCSSSTNGFVMDDVSLKEVQGGYILAAGTVQGDDVAFSSGTSFLGTLAHSNTAARTYTFPDATATLLADNTPVTTPQGGTGLTAGTSGGIPYFSGATTIASSAALTDEVLVKGGGAGNAPEDSTLTETEVKTRQIGFTVGADNGAVMVDADDWDSFYINDLGFGITLIKVWCETDSDSSTINLQRDDGSAANILSASLACDADGQTSCASGCDVNTIQDAEDNIADGEKIDFEMVLAGGTAKRVVVYLKYTID